MSSHNVQTRCWYNDVVFLDAIAPPPLMQMQADKTEFDARNDRDRDKKYYGYPKAARSRCKVEQAMKDVTSLRPGNDWYGDYRAPNWTVSPP